MSNLALLVDCLKIINWLEDRKKLRKDWYNYLKAGEEKVKLLLKDREWAINYPSIHDYITANEQNFNVRDVQKVVQLLLQSDLAQQKNMFFGYSDKRVKQWTTLKKYLSGNHLTLLNLAKFIEQSLRFDLPGLNKTIQSYDNQLATLKRKIDFNNNTIFQQLKGLQKQRALLGVSLQQKAPVQKLIQSVVSKGPQQILQLQNLIKVQQIQKYLQYYNQSNQKNQTENALDTLSYFITNGDQFNQVHKDAQNKQKYDGVKKYRQFQSWKGSNQWEIQIQGQSHEIKEQIDQSTVIQSREFRQHLLYDLSQLLFFFKGCKHQIVTAQKGLGFESQQSKDVTLVEGQISKAIDQLQKVISYLTSKRLTAPLQLKNSKKAYQVLVRQFKGFQANIQTMQSQIKSYRSQIIQLQQIRQKQVQKLTFLRRKVAQSRPVCQNLLCQIVKRQVKITGQINKL